jgi:hypothetical protein
VASTIHQSLPVMALALGAAVNHFPEAEPFDKEMTLLPI